MFLSGLELIGFKSFPKRTKLTFQPGVMSIVGPNGCGKTNLVDAVRWVLGEQRTSILRSEKMENVIFAGANGHKPTQMAEITLTIENNQGVLHEDFSEVTVTRRLHRNGDSEYLINKRPVRLKDIRNLFADTGLGPDSYSIIELSMVEGILAGRPEERRKLFEEAAGVTLYKSRLKDTRNKLSATEADLKRLEDLVGEVASQRRSLQRQVRRAKRYRFLTEALRVKELSASREEVADIRARLNPINERIIQERDKKQRLEKELTKLDEDLASTRGKLGALEEQVSTLTSEKDSGEARLQNVRLEITKLDERLRAGQQRKEQRGRDEEDLVKRQKETAQLVKKLDLDKDQAAKKKEEIQLRLENINREIADFEDRLKGSRSEVSSCENEIHLLEQGAARLESGISQVKEQLTRLENRKSQINSELKNNKPPEGIEELSQAVSSLTKTVETLEEKVKQTLTERDKTREERIAAHNEVIKVSQDLEAAEQRVKLLDRIVSSGEGRPKAVKQLLGSKIEGIAGRLGDAVVVEDKWRLALAAALEEVASAIVVEKKSSWNEAVSFLVEEDRGRGMIVTLENLREPPEIDSDIEAREGLIAPLIEKARFKGSAGKAARRLLANVWLVDTFDNLIKNADFAVKNNLSLITEDGCRLTRDGFVVAGTVDAEDLGASQLLEEAGINREELRKTLKTLQKNLDNSKEKESSSEQEYKKIFEEFEIARKNLSDELKKLTAAEAALTSYENLEERIKQEIERIASVEKDLEKRSTSLGTELTKKQKEIEQKSLGLSNLKQDFENAEEEGLSLAAAKEKLRDEQVLSSSSLGQIESELRSHATIFEEIGLRLEQIENEKFDAEGAQEDATERLRMIKAEEAVLQRETEENGLNLEKARKKYDQVRNTFAEKSSTLETKRQELSITVDSLHSKELEQSDLKHRLTTVRETIIDNYGIDLLTASQEELPLAVDESNPYLEKTLSELREGLRDVGPVNQMAIEEFEVIDMRYKSLLEQQEDLVGAKDALTETIDEINSIARERFLSTFTRVEGHFIRLFAKLFGGGEAALSLGEGDPLDAGIKIYGSPKGKRLTSIDLLSGGEKAMTAIALLFSLYLERPAPFCFLDEVDAPLDDENVLRFNNLLREFTESTQFLVVTHNKLTMEKADRLYGVTMEEEGISKLVAVEIPGNRKSDDSREPTEEEKE